jgi:hypothetical protein
MFAREETTYG